MSHETGLLILFLGLTALCAAFGWAHQFERRRAAEERAKAREIRNMCVELLGTILVYDAQLDALEISPNGDDYNDLFATVTHALRTGSVPEMAPPTEEHR